MGVQLATAGISHELEIKISLACNLLHACDLSIDLRPWIDGSCDAVVVDLNDRFGRLVYDMAVRRQLRILAFTTEHNLVDPGTKTLERDISVVAIAMTLREILGGKIRLNSRGNLPGLLGITQRVHGFDEPTVARCGSLEVMLRPSAGRIHFTSRSDIDAAKNRLVDKSWAVSRVKKISIDKQAWANSFSLDGFLIGSCRRHEEFLPVFGEQEYRLTVWPDLGGLIEDVDVLRMTVALHALSWSVTGLANHLGISATRSNSFFSATLASGTLERVPKSIHAELGSHFPITSPIQNRVPALLKKVACHFKVRI
jgi:hypothetical protein